MREECKKCDERFSCEYFEGRYGMNLCNMDTAKREEQNEAEKQARADMLAATKNIWRFS